MADLPADFPHRFCDLQLAASALAGPPEQTRRLAWLGDRALSLALVQILAEVDGRTLADLSRAESFLASNHSLAHLARRLELPARLQGSFGTRKLATVLEALIGAVLVDGGADAVRACVAALYAPLIEQLGEDLYRRDAKTVLKERCEMHEGLKPEYEIETAAPAQARYEVVCRVGSVSSRGCGATLRAAQIAAASALLSRLEADSRQ